MNANKFVTSECWTFGVGICHIINLLNMISRVLTPLISKLAAAQNFLTILLAILINGN